MTPEEGNYSNVHAWLRREHGVANKCEGKDCLDKSKTFEWALRKGSDYKKDVACFIMLCCSCHRKYDLTDATRIKMSQSAKKGGHFVRNNPMKMEVTKLKASQWMKKRVVSVETREKHSVRLKGTIPAFIKTGSHHHKSGGSNPAAKKVFDTITKREFSTVAEAAEYFGLKRTTLIAMLKGQNPNKTNLAYV